MGFPPMDLVMFLCLSSNSAIAHRLRVLEQMIQADWRLHPLPQFRQQTLDAQIAADEDIRVRTAPAWVLIEPPLINKEGGGVEVDAVRLNQLYEKYQRSTPIYLCPHQEPDTIAVIQRALDTIHERRGLPHVQMVDTNKAAWYVQIHSQIIRVSANHEIHELARQFTPGQREPGSGTDAEWRKFCSLVPHYWNFLHEETYDRLRQDFCIIQVDNGTENGTVAVYMKGAND